MTQMYYLIQMNDKLNGIVFTDDLSKYKRSCYKNKNAVITTMTSENVNSEIIRILGHETANAISFIK